MPCRWVICPVVTESGVRKPKVSVLKDPGRPPKPGFDDLTGLPIFTEPTYQHSSIVSDGLPGQPTWCVSLVFGVDLTPLDTDPEIISILEEDAPTQNALRDILSKTPEALGWSILRLDHLRQLLVTRGVTDVPTSQHSCVEWLNRLAVQVHQQHTGVQGLVTTETR